jgi:HAD superfamily hydrolase (TIGR01490 family)
VTEGGRGAAFFDLDKTLMQGSSGFQFAQAARELGLISRRQLISDGLANLRFRLRGVTDAESEALRHRIASSLEGVRVRDLERLGVHVLQRVLPRLYPQMLARAYEHQDAGRPVFIVTAASEGLAQLLARVMTFDGAIGSHLSEVQDGVYTGRATGVFLYGEAKAEAIRELAERQGIDLEQSFAYSDSASDLPMLRAVGHPAVVNPDAELHALAADGGWEIIRLDPLRGRLFAGAGLGLAAVGGGAAAAILTKRHLESRARTPRGRQSPGASE